MIKLWRLSLLLLPLQVFSQNQSHLIINEVGFFPGTEKAFIELIVVNNANEPLTGWSIDNYNSDVFSDDGYIEFSSDFPILGTGSRILIYNDIDKPIGIDNVFDENYTQDGFLQIPFSSELLVKVSDGLRSNNATNTWRDYLSVNNSQNGIYVSNAQRNLRNYVSWGVQGVTNNGPFWAIASQGAIGPNATALVLENACDVSIPTQVEVAESPSYSSGLTTGTPTPGRFNSYANRGIIQTIQNGNLANITMSSSCEQISAADDGQTNGMFRVNVQGGVAPLTPSVNGPNNSNPMIEADESGFQVVNLSTGNYEITITDQNGCIETCSVFIGRTASTQVICNEGSQVIGRALGPDECGFTWNPELGLADPENSITEAYPSESTTYELIISDGNGGVLTTETYEVSVINSLIEPEISVICPSEFQDLTAEYYENATYTWSLNGEVLNESSHVYRALESGDYSCSIELNGNSCEGTAKVFEVGDQEGLIAQLEAEGWDIINITVDEEFSLTSENNSRTDLDICFTNLVQYDNDPENSYLNLSSLLQGDLDIATSFNISVGGAIVEYSNDCDDLFCDVNTALNPTSGDFTISAIVFNASDEDDILALNYNEIDPTIFVEGGNVSPPSGDPILTIDTDNCDPDDLSECLPYHKYDITGNISDGYVGYSCENNNSWQEVESTTYSVRDAADADDDAWGDGNRSTFEVTRTIIATSTGLYQEEEVKPSFKAYNYFLDNVKADVLENKFLFGFNLLGQKQTEKNVISDHWIKGYPANPLSTSDDQGNWNTPLQWDCNKDFALSIGNHPRFDISAEPLAGLIHDWFKDNKSFDENWRMEMQDFMELMYSSGGNRFQFDSYNLRYFWAYQIFGGTQALKVHISDISSWQILDNFTPDRDIYQIDILYEIVDSFGGSKDDGGRVFLKGLVELWFLQHFRNFDDSSDACIETPCYIPFRHSVVVPTRLFVSIPH